MKMRECMPSVAAVLMFAAAAVAQRQQCSTEQRSCVKAAWEIIKNETAVTVGDSCVDLEGLFGDLVACLGSDGCSGVDLSEMRSSCENLKVTRSDICSFNCEPLLYSTNSISEDEPEDYYEIKGTSYPFVTASHNYYPYPLSSVNASAFRVQWQVEGKLMKSGTPLSSGEQVVPVSGGEVVLIGSRGGVNWRFKSFASDQGVEFSGSPVVTNDGSIVIGDSAGYLYQISINGELNNSWNLGGSIKGSAAVVDGYAFALSRGSVGNLPTLHKVALTAGAVNAWRIPVCSHDSLTMDWVSDGLSIAGNKILVACQWQGYVDAFNMISGEREWSAQVSTVPRGSAMTVSISAPVVGDDETSFVIANNTVVKLSSSGQVTWRSTHTNSLSNQAAVDWSRQAAYFTDVSGKVLRLSLQSGIVQNSVTLTQVPTSNVALSQDGVLAVGTESGLHLIGSENFDQLGTIDLQSPKHVRINSDGSLSLSSPEVLATSLVSTPTLAPTMVPTFEPTSSPTDTLAPSRQPTEQPTQATSAPTASKNVTAPPVEPQPTFAPTQFPTKQDSGSVATGSPSTDRSQQDGQDGGWPLSAIITVSVLGGADVLLVAGIVALRKKTVTGASADPEKQDSGKVDDFAPESPSAASGGSDSPAVASEAGAPIQPSETPATSEQVVTA